MSHFVAVVTFINFELFRKHHHSIRLLLLHKKEISNMANQPSADAHAIIDELPNLRRS
ncbi:MAG: tmRNA-binding protein, partial [Bacillariaceae sp.]